MEIHENEIHQKVIQQIDIDPNNMQQIDKMHNSNSSESSFVKMTLRIITLVHVYDIDGMAFNTANTFNTCH